MAEEEEEKHALAVGSTSSSSLPDARWYQLEALEKAVRENTIVFLETGAGKTLIAVLLLRSYAHLIRKPSPSFAVFLVPTVVLVGQQARVLEMHTDLKVGKFYGDMGVDFWKADTWNRMLDRFEVLVMTPQILLDNLRHSFFKLHNIKLLIFDECHHAKGNSPYACILKEFYHPQLNSKSLELPRIFGMTASPIDSKGSNSGIDYSKQIFQLETIMNSKVYTVDNDSVLSQYIPFATPRMVHYDESIIQSELHNHFTYFLTKLEAKHLEDLGRKLDDSSLQSAQQRISRLQKTFLYCITELGVWLAAKAAEILSYKESCLSFWVEKGEEIVESYVRIYSQEVYKELSHFTKREVHIDEDFEADLQAGLLTAKVHCLIQSLLKYRVISNVKKKRSPLFLHNYTLDEQRKLALLKCGLLLVNSSMHNATGHLQELRCIIFVERVITAMVLHSLLSNIHQISGWGVKYMAGKSSSLQSQRRKEQTEIVDAFRSGKVKIIVATQILEEGLDVPSCNLVIRFDLSATVCSFLQSRGRARMQNSDYILLLRRGDTTALSKMENFLKSGEVMREESLRLASTCCQPLRNTLCEEKSYRVESTEAIVTLNSSVALIHSFCSKLPSDDYFKPLPRFVINKVLSTCTLHLPKSIPLQPVQAEGKSDVFKQIVCLKACKELHAIGALTDYLLPECDVPSEEDEPNIVVEQYQHEQPDYFPGELTDTWFSFSRLGLYYCYKISLQGCFSNAASPSDIILVVKSDLGSDIVSNLFKLEGARDSLTVAMKYVGVVHLSHEQVIVARRFQTIILTLLINNDFAELNDAMKFLCEVQVSVGVVYLLLPSISGKIDWCSIKFAAFPVHKAIDHDIAHCHSCKGVHSMQTKDGPLCKCMLQNSVVYTPHNQRLYLVTGILDLDVNSPLHLRDGSVISYKSYYKTRHGLSLTCETQPLLAGRSLFKVQNFLNRRHKESSDSGVELPPELCRIVMSPVSANTLYFFSFLPTIMYRIQCMLLSARLKVQLGHSMQQFSIATVKLLEAITMKKCQEEYSQESLETLGDSFLKYVTSQHLFNKYKRHHEGILTNKKKNMNSNAALCQLACNRNLVGYIRDEEFNPKNWIIPGLGYDTCGNNKVFCLSSNDTCILRKRSIKSKRIADSVEALIGAYLSAAGELAAFLFIKSLGMEIEFYKEMAVPREMPRKPEEFISVRSLEILLGYNFNDPSLLMEALTHGSYQIAGTTGCYQRLEFLGDAVLDHLITVYFYNQYPEITPELLTDLRSASVNNNCYAHSAAKAGLNKHILHSSSELHRRMSYYLENFGQSFSGSSHGWQAGIALPKVLGDVIESIAGAIYLDSQCDKDVVWRSMRRLLEPLATPETVERDPVKELGELCARRSYVNSYTKAHENGVSSVVAEVQAEGTVYKAARTGPNKDVAKKLAAKAVLQDLKAAISETSK